MLSFKPTFFILIKRLFSFSSLSAIKVVSSAYLRLLMFLQAILIPACGSSRPGFHTMYSAHKLKKQGDNIHTALSYFFLKLEPLLFHVWFYLLFLNLYTGFLGDR